ncbi:hypothetical protein FCN77_10050 [Arthrobacter sp. 24S4-2]|nr:hypothetical protein FCN77_10050 [Arthrobacter sp. 24S4-2]
MAAVVLLTLAVLALSQHLVHSDSGKTPQPQAAKASPTSGDTLFNGGAGATGPPGRTADDARRLLPHFHLRTEDLITGTTAVAKVP